METLLGPESRQCSIPVTDPSSVAAARREGARIAQAYGLDETAAGRLANVIMEAGTNVVKYGGGGEILIRPCGTADTAAVEVLALDRGPGMADLSTSMHDGVSASGTYGLGLGAMSRLADEFDIFTAPEKGTAIWMTVWAAPPPRHAAWELGVVCQPMPGETLPGDSWGVRMSEAEALLLVADGLGHGHLAAEASEAAVGTLSRLGLVAPELLLEEAHADLRDSRGAAAAVARVQAHAGQVHFAGVGNIAASISGAGSRRQLVSHNGIVGSNLRKVQAFSAPWPDDGLLILHSDGLGSKWDLASYPGLASCHPALVAAVLYRDFWRRRDDVTVLAMRNGRGG